MSERKDFINEMQEEAVHRYGAELTPAQVAYQFSLHGPEARIAHLKAIKTPESMNVEQAGKRHALERAVRMTHEKLRLAGR
jgi:hypothetical protein